MSTWRNKFGKIALFAGAALSLGSWCAPAFANPWVEADDVYLRLSLQQLADAGYLKGNMSTFPLMWSGIVRDLRNISAAQLSESDRLAYYRVRSALNFAQQERVNTVRMQASSERVRAQGFADTYYEHGRLRASRAFISNHSAGRLQTNVRLGTADQKDYTFEGSFLATTIGNWAFSVDQMPVWWGQGQQNALVLSTNSRPVQAFRFNRLQDDASSLPVLAWLGNWHATAFYGRTQNHGPLGDQEIAGGRVSIRPWTALTVAASFTVEAGSKLGERNQLLGIDGRLSLPFATALYGEVAERQGRTRLTNQRAFTVGLDHYLGRGPNLQQVFVEYTEVPAYFYDDALDPAGYRRWEQNLGAGIDQDIDSVTMGYRFQRANGQAWRVYYQDQRIGGMNYLAAFQHDYNANTFSIDRRALNVNFQQGFAEGLLNIGIAYQYDKVARTLTNSGLERTSKGRLEVRLGWELRY